MVIKRETLEQLEKSSIISILINLTTAQFLDHQKAYENEMLVEYLLLLSSSSSASADLLPQTVPPSSSETRGGILQQRAQEEVTLNQQLLHDFEVLDAKKSELNRQIK